ncbi:MAG: hypothetical protein IJ461_06455 [Clostridia bacterium]|nr:hypothetical protein [Clostridia bacterium]
MVEREDFKNAVDHRLSGLKADPYLARRIMAQQKGEEPVMKKRVSFAAVLLVILALAGTVALGTEWGVLKLFMYNDTPNGSVAQGVQPVNASYQGQVVSCRMEEAVYDAPGKSWALSWTMNNLTNEEGLYVVQDNPLVGGESAHWRSATFGSEYFLPQGESEGMMLGELPENKGETWEMHFTVLRPLAEYEDVDPADTTEEYLKAIADIRSRGKIPVEGDGYIYTEQKSDEGYVQSLLATGQFEKADEFTLTFTLAENLLDSACREYMGEKTFVFENYELRIREAYTTATAAYIQVEYITPEKPVDGGKGMGWLWGLDFTVPGMTAWTGNASGSFEDPVQLPDGRWMNVYTYEAMHLFAQPETIVMTLETYDEDFNRTLHTEDAVELRF